VNESIQTEIRFKPQSAVISTDEVALLESILPEIIHAMMQAEMMQQIKMGSLDNQVPSFIPNWCARQESNL
jgi:hypothetical protein